MAEGTTAMSGSDYRRGVAQPGQSSGLQTRMPQVQILPPLHSTAPGA